MDAPEITRENMMWYGFFAELLSPYYSAKIGKKAESKELENFLGFLRDIKNEHLKRGNSLKILEIIYEDNFYESHKITPKITNYDLKKHLEGYLDELNSKGEKKTFNGLIIDLEKCCENILKEPNKREKFGERENIYRGFLNYLKNNPYSALNY